MNVEFRKLIATLLLACLSFQQIWAQGSYADFRGIIKGLYGARGETQLNQRWGELVSAKRIPLVQEDSVAFLYRGEARTVVWMGDFNGWGNSKNFNNKGTRIPETDIWILKASLPTDARLDYKILIDENHWILDPVNASSQWSGVGGGSLNSELRLPDWKEDALTKYPLPDAPRGNIQKDILFNSLELGYQVTFSVYTPPQYQKDEAYPVLYVTDGYEYMHERLGNMITVLDNLIHLQKIQPVIAVFIDHREPVNRSVNRRIQELGMNKKYLNFITLELIPAVEEKFSAVPSPSHRAMIGSSLGGLSAAWFAFSRPDVFGMAGIQSPAFWFNPEIFTLIDQTNARPVKIFMTTGLVNDAEEGARKMRAILLKKNCVYEFKEVNQGHSWGNWRDLIDDMLIFLFPSGT